MVICGGFLDFLPRVDSLLTFLILGFLSFIFPYSVVVLVQVSYRILEIDRSGGWRLVPENFLQSLYTHAVFDTVDAEAVTKMMWM